MDIITIMTRDAQFLLLQINDAVFPIGAYTQSYGLETYVQKDMVCDAQRAEEYICANLMHAFLYSELLCVRVAYERAVCGDIEGLMQLEALSLASRVPRELREAASRLGGRFTRTAEELGCELLPSFAQYVQACAATGVTHAAAYGVFCAAAKLPLDDVLAAFAYAQTSAMVVNAVKLVPLGQMAGQKMLSRLRVKLDALCTQVRALDDSDLFRTAPGLDVRAMQHERLYSRLYMS